jgi:hypothetical protein
MSEKRRVAVYLINQDIEDFSGKSSAEVIEIIVGKHNEGKSEKAHSWAVDLIREIKNHNEGRE